MSSDMRAGEREGVLQQIVARLLPDVVARLLPDVVRAELHGDRAAAPERPGASLTPGTKLVHTYRGREVATCIFEDEDKWIYRGRAYPSKTAAAMAAIRRLGMKAESVNADRFWGLGRWRRS